MQLAIFPKDYYSFAHRVDITLRGILLGRGINMKKWNWHSYAAGMVSAVLIVGMATPALADVVGQMSQNQVNIVANGSTISSAGQNYTLEGGNEVPSSITFTDSSGGGTVYLPVRRVSQILGVEIGWDGARNAVVIGGGAAPIQDASSQNKSTNVQNGAGIAVLGTTFETNYVGGVTPTVYWKNTSGKDIKYVEFTLIPYNRVNDIVSCDILGTSTHVMQVVGPIYPYTAPSAETAGILEGYFFWHFGKVCPVNRRHVDPGTGGDWVPNGEFFVDDGELFGETYTLTEADMDEVVDQAWTSNEVCWYNYDVARIDVTKVEITYMDGTTETINDPVMFSQI